MKKDGGVQYRISGSFGDSAIPLLLDFFLLEGSTTAHDGSTTEEGALYSTSGDELQQPGATGDTAFCDYLEVVKLLHWINSSIIMGCHPPVPTTSIGSELFKQVANLARGAIVSTMAILSPLQHWYCIGGRY